MTERDTLTAQQIADHLVGTVVGSNDVQISSVELIERATAQHLAFVGSPKQLGRVKTSQAKLILVPEECSTELEAFDNATFILVDDPESAFLEIASILQPRREKTVNGISSTAVIAESASIGQDITIGHHVVIGEDVTIGANCRIEHGTIIGDGCTLGDNVVLHPNCVLYSDVIIGSDVILHSACVIGAEGFGYRTVDGRHKRLPHFGTVRICDDVEIGAATTIDRAKIGETTIGSGTRIDNQVMIAHNCQIGEHNLLVSQVGFAGSVSTGSYVVCGGQAGIADHVHLGDGCRIGAQTGVHRDMKGDASYFGTPAAPIADAAKQMMALRRLPEMRSSLKKLEKEIANLHQQTDPDSTSNPEMKAA